MTGSAPVLVRPVRANDAAAVWDLLAAGIRETVGMSSLPGSSVAAEEVCSASAATVAALATGEFELTPGQEASVLLVAIDLGSDRVLGTSGLTFKERVPNLAVQVTTSLDGQGLTMRSTSEDWTRTELNAIYAGREGRGRGLGTLLSRSRLLFLQLVRSQTPATVAAHLRGRFDDDGRAPFWNSFGAHFSPWKDSVEAEGALAAGPDRLQELADLVLPLTARDLDSLGLVNDASLNAFRLLMLEGLRSNGLYDPIDGGPTVSAELAETATSRDRVHGPLVISESLGPVDAIVSSPSVANFGAVRTGIKIDPEGRIHLAADVSATLRIGEGGLVTALPLPTNGTRT